MELLDCAQVLPQAPSPVLGVAACSLRICCPTGTAIAQVSSPVVAHRWSCHRRHHHVGCTRRLAVTMLCVVSVAASLCLLLLAPVVPISKCPYTWFGCLGQLSSYYGLGATHSQQLVANSSWFPLTVVVRVGAVGRVYLLSSVQLLLPCRDQLALWRCPQSHYMVAAVAQGHGVTDSLRGIKGQATFSMPVIGRRHTYIYRCAHTYTHTFPQCSCWVSPGQFSPCC